MKYGFIGCGNMGSAIARALAKNTTDFAVTDRSGKAKEFAREIGCGYDTSRGLAASCERLFLAVKPQMMQAVLAPLQSILSEKRPLLISMAAGLTISQIREMVGCDLPILRIMPNTPAAVGKGVILYCRNSEVTDAVLADVLEDLCFAGRFDPVEEALFDAAGTVSGCSPAYAYLFIEALADGAVACGVPRAKALEYAAGALSGAAEMVLQTGTHPGVLKDAVCSPWGSTIAGIRVLEEQGFRGAVMDCIIAATERTKALKKG